jgi:hypothetical protein
MNHSHFWVSPNIADDVIYVYHVPWYLLDLNMHFDLYRMTGSFGAMKLCSCFANYCNNLYDLKFPLTCDKHSGFLGASEVLSLAWIYTKSGNSIMLVEQKILLSNDYLCLVNKKLFNILDNNLCIVIGQKIVA